MASDKHQVLCSVSKIMWMQKKENLNSSSLLSALM